MAEKELRRMTGNELIELITQMQNEIEVLQKENDELSARAAKREEAITNASSIAEASFSLNGIKDAMNASVNSYLTSIRANHAEEEKKVEAAVARVAEECRKLMSDAEEKAAALEKETNKFCAKYETVTKTKVDQINQEADELHAKIQDNCDLLNQSAELYVAEQWKKYKEKTEDFVKENKDLQKLLRISEVLKEFNEE